MNIEIVPEPFHGPIAVGLLEAFEVEMANLYGRPPQVTPPQPDGMMPPEGAFLVVYVDDQPVGCGGIRALTGDTAEVRRMFVAPRLRGQGLGRQLLSFLEQEARALGYRFIELETGERNTAAQNLYTTNGYERIGGPGGGLVRGRKRL